MVGKTVLDAGVERLLGVARARLGSRSPPQRLGVRRPGRRPLPRLPLDAGAPLVFGAAIEQRIAFEFGLDIRDQIEVGELQQLDRLHQLRRHHQRLALAEL